MTRLCALSLLLLSGCVTAEQAQQQQAARIADDDATCRSYGVARGSDAYVACRMNLTNNHATQDTVADINRARRSRTMMLIGASMLR